ncbi:hypothetical protein GTU99_08660, partial [Streptomyces sp. PRKS01-65]|nr:hypothetical protein [Streptomyces harenosi]
PRHRLRPAPAPAPGEPARAAARESVPLPKQRTSPVVRGGGERVRRTGLGGA